MIPEGRSGLGFDCFLAGHLRLSYFFRSSINNQQSSMKWVAVQLFLRFQRKSLGLQKTFVKYRQSQA
jgi:hypothetical protein